MGPILVLLLSLFLTILVEGAVIMLCLHSKETLRCSLYVNILTNPPLNLTLLLLAGTGWSSGAMWTLKIALEIAVVLIEAVAYKFMLGNNFKKTLWLSFIANLTSFVTGELIGMAGYWRL